MNIIETNLSFSAMTNRSKTTRIILHHAEASSCTAEQIHQWHKNNGWSGAGYHFLVRKDGKVYRLRPENKVGAHASGSNSDSIGVCFEGKYMTETMPAAQKNAGKELVSYLKSKYGISKVQKHSDVCSTDCPGKNFPFNEIVAGGTTVTTNKPKQVPGNPVNNAGLQYRAHVQSIGWCDPVHDGQTAGTTGYGLRLEAIKITPPDGLELEVKAHIQGIGWKSYKGIKKGASSGTGSSANDPIIGTVGESKRLEDLIINVTKNTTGKILKYRVHRQSVGWGSWMNSGEACGSVGMSNRIEAIQMKLI